MGKEKRLISSRTVIETDSPAGGTRREAIRAQAAIERQGLLDEFFRVVGAAEQRALSLHGFRQRIGVAGRAEMVQSERGADTSCLPCKLVLRGSQQSTGTSESAERVGKKKKLYRSASRARQSVRCIVKYKEGH